MIHTSLSPNTESDDLWLTFKSLFFPWNWFSWKNGRHIEQFEKNFREYLPAKHSFTFQRGRGALFILLKALGIGAGDEVILQAYTCIVVPNAIQFCGAKPVYVDIEENGFNIDPQLIEKSITPQTKAVIIQHTFGEAADIEKIQKICREHKLFLIEDCAHSLSGSHHGKKLGTFGAAAMFSFGRDKIISSVWGGMVTTDDDELAVKIKLFRDSLPYPSFGQIIQALAHPLIFSLIKPVYHWKIGKGLLVLAQKMKLIPRVIFPPEKQAIMPQFFPQKMPNVLARLALHQLNKLDKFHQHRQKLAEYYTARLNDNSDLTLPKPNSHSAWLRYTIRTPKAGELIKSARQQGVYLGDWYRQVLAPEDCALEKFQYQPGSCPRAEKAAEQTVNLPTHIQVGEKDVEKVVNMVE